MKTLTVKELMEELAKYPEDLDVWVEGCDCTGEAVSTQYDRIGGKQVVLIERKPLL